MLNRTGSSFRGTQVKRCLLPAYTPTPADVGWAAGLFDGEGTIGAYKRFNKGRPSYGVQVIVSISQTCKLTLEHFQKVMGVQSAIYGVNMRDKMTRPAFVLPYYGRRGLLVLQRLEPHLVRKAEQLRVCHDLVEKGRIFTLPGPRGFDDQVWTDREALMARLKDLK